MTAQAPLIETDTFAVWNLRPPADSQNAFRVVETSKTRANFDAGHIPGSVFWPIDELVDSRFRLRTDPQRLAALLERSGITPDTTVVCSWNDGQAIAAWLFWILTGFGHQNAVVLNGGTSRWRAEYRPVTSSQIDASCDVAPIRDLPAFAHSTRAMLSDVRAAVARQGERESVLLDARSKREYRGGHIPGARHFPHSLLLKGNGTFRSREELSAVCDKAGLRREHEIIVYCAVGIRSSLVWFALKHLLGFPHVRNFDGSWNEWSRLSEGHP